MTPNELMHYGRKGMRWGKRSFTTEELKTGKALMKDSKDIINGGKTINSAVRKAKKSSHEQKRKSPNLSKMTDKELQQAVQRMNMEKQYSDLTRTPF